MEALHKQRLANKPNFAVIRSKLIASLQQANSATIGLLYRTDFPLTVARCIVDVCFCGFSRDDLISPTGREPHVQVKLPVSRFDHNKLKSSPRNTSLGYCRCLQHACIR